MAKDFLLIDRNGLAYTEELRKKLQPFNGKWFLASSSNGILVFEKEILEEERDNIIFSGYLDRTDVVEVINFIQSAQKSGNLTILSEEIRKSIYFKNGDIKGAISNQKTDRIGEIMYRLGVISREQLDEALNKLSPHKKLGQILVEKGFLNPHQVWRFIRKQIEEIFYSVLIIRSGYFIFSNFNVDALPVNFGFKTQNLLLEGVRRIDELKYFREKFPANDIIAEKRDSLPETTLNQQEEVILNLIDGKRNIEELSKLSHYGDFDTIKILFHLVQAGFIQTIEKSTTIGREIQKGQLKLSKIIDNFNRLFKVIYIVLKQKGVENILIQGLESFQVTYGFSDLFKEIFFDEDGTIAEDLILQNLAQSEIENKHKFLYQGLNELLFFEMFAAKEYLNPKEEQMLTSQINKLFSESFE